MINYEILASIIGEFAALYGGEIDVSLISVEHDHFTVKFMGWMCKTCGVDEYFEGLAYTLRLKGIEARLVDYKEEGGVYIVTYAI